MASDSAIDVEIGWYDQASCWVDYFPVGTIETRPTPGRLHAVLHFHPSARLPDLPMGVLPVARPGGLLRAKRTAYQVIVGSTPIEGVAYPDPTAARQDAWFRALRIAVAVSIGTPETTPFLTHIPAFHGEQRMFTVRFYGNWLDEAQTVMLHSVVHFEGDVSRPAVPFAMTERQEARQTRYYWGFAPDGGQIQFVRGFSTDEEASMQLAFAIPSLASALFVKATADKWGEMWADIDPSKRMEAGMLTPAEAQVEYERILRTLHTSN
ncbi:MAG TPA: hypothetical protein VFL91_29855 [Thermomicrobiales bacterium]|nr:hypothetical protein [Thermomicrobiales bacterium]